MMPPELLHLVLRPSAVLVVGRVAIRLLLLLLLAVVRHHVRVLLLLLLLSIVVNGLQQLCGRWQRLRILILRPIPETVRAVRRLELVEVVCDLQRQQWRLHREQLLLTVWSIIVVVVVVIVAVAACQIVDVRCLRLRCIRRTDYHRHWRQLLIFHINVPLFEFLFN
jgi:hypothetical protein